MKKVVVVGSINMDLVTRCKRAPKGGETLLERSFSKYLVEKELTKQWLLEN